MFDSLHIAIFAKAPVAGLAKTRLIPMLGAAGAAQAQQLMTTRALTIATAAAPSQVSLWSDGDFAQPFLQQCARDFEIERYAQCVGDLGVRMADCLRTLLQRHARVLLIGSDCPVLSSADLLDAATALQSGARMVFTPAQDGGYVLVGARQSATGIALEIMFTQAFDCIAWSTADVMQQSRARLTEIGWHAGRDWAEMPTRWDVDLPDDYLRAQRDGLL